MKRRVKGIIFLAGVIGTLSFSLTFQPQIPFPNLAAKLENYYQRYPQQKAYLHLDKQAYHAGERIWYKAYLVDARTHKPDTIGKNLIVEIVNSFGVSSMIQLAKLDRGFAQGDFYLPDTIPEGLYQIRAYTNWMRNFGPEYFFRRDINIWNPEHAVTLYRDDKLANKRHKKKSIRKSKKIDVQFFPEGGYLVEGLESKVGFKAINDLGLGIDIEGTILENKKKTVGTFSSQHLGMGAFSLTPEKGKEYYAEIKSTNGKPQRFELPEALESGYVLNVVDNQDNKLKLVISSTLSDPMVMIACHMRGKIVYRGQVRLVDGSKILDIPLNDVPSGILHITLFDSNREPRCERLIFIRSEDLLRIAVLKEKTEFKTREKVTISILARDQQDNPVAGNFSMSVSDRDLVNTAGDFQSGIKTNLLLTSDLAGRIENPEYYFDSKNKDASEALDYLLMTQGWRRFIWDDVVNETQLDIQYPIQKGLSVHGRITNQLFDIGLKNVPVTLTVLSEFNDVFLTQTDDRGRYYFDLPDYEDTIQVEITARKSSGKKNLLIHINDDDLPESEEIYSSYSRDMIVRGTNVFKPMPEKEIDTMKAETKGIYYQADYVLEVTDQMRTSYTNILDMIQGRIPGVFVSGNNVLIRGPTSLYMSNEPLYLIDNIPVDVAAVQSVNPMDVDRIEVLKGPSAAIYGSRGANGVIAIFTKRGRFMIKGILNFDMLGYHKPREFYSPKYGTEFDQLVEDYRTSLYWNPGIRTDSTGMAQVSFYTSDINSTFYIVVEGVSTEGQIGSNEKIIQVR
jgi:TonB-dependent SusC/RagA subfamily outer membrane receptor